MKAFPWPFLLPLPSCPGREQVPVVWDCPNPPPASAGLQVPPGQSLLPHVPTKGDDLHQAPATSSLPVRRPSWDVGWGLTHLPQSCRWPQCAQPAPACPCPAPGGHKGTVRANPSLVLDGIPKRAAPKGWGSGQVQGAGEGRPPPTCCPPLSLTSPMRSTFCSLLTKTPSGCPWGLVILPGDRKGGGSWAAASPPQPDTTSRETPENTAGISAACRLPGGMGWQVSPKIPLWG